MQQRSMAQDYAPVMHGPAPSSQAARQPGSQPGQAPPGRPTHLFPAEPQAGQTVQLLTHSTLSTNMCGGVQLLMCGGVQVLMCHKHVIREGACEDTHGHSLTWRGMAAC